MGNTIVQETRLIGAGAHHQEPNQGYIIHVITTGPQTCTTTYGIQGDMRRTLTTMMPHITMMADTTMMPHTSYDNINFGI